MDASRLLRWLGLACLTLLPLAKADMFDLTPAGLAAVREKHLLEPIAHADGKSFFIEGYVIVPRDATDQNTLPYPIKYFMFRPLRGLITGTDFDGNPKPDAKEVRLEYNWLRLYHVEWDTLDDIRGLISNRDLRYNSGAEAIDALIADIDPDGALQLKGNVPVVVDANVVPREGQLSQFWIYGPTTAAEQQVVLRKLHAITPSDPHSYNPMDSRVWDIDPGNTIGHLMTTMARCDKWGESEPGVRASTQAVTQLMTERLYVDLDHVAPSGKEKGQRIFGHVLASRRTVLSTLELGCPGFLSRETKPGYKSNADLPFTPADDLQPVTYFDSVKVALQLISTWTPRQADADRMFQDLVACASGRSDFFSAGSRFKLSADAAKAADVLGRQAFDVLLQLAKAPPAGQPDPGKLVRTKLISGAMQSGPMNAETKVCAEAFVRSGMADDTEIAPALDRIIDFACDARDVYAAVRPTAAYMLKHVAQSIADPGRRARYQAELDRRILLMRDPNSHYGDSGPGKFLAAYDQTP